MAQEYTEEEKLCIFFRPALQPFVPSSSSPPLFFSFPSLSFFVVVLYHSRKIVRVLSLRIYSIEADGGIMRASSVTVNGILTTEIVIFFGGRAGFLGRQEG